VKDQLERLVDQMVEHGIPYMDAVNEFEKRFIQNVLDKNKRNQSKAAKALGIHRNTLSRRIEELGLDGLHEHRKRTRARLRPEHHLSATNFARETTTRLCKKP
jgi:DNA-binding NtrC family response regulator